MSANADSANVFPISRGVPSTTRPPLLSGADTRETPSMQRVFGDRSRFGLRPDICGHLQSVCVNVLATTVQTWHSQFMKGSWQ